MERRDASKKKSDFEVQTINLIDRRYGVSRNIKLKLSGADKISETFSTPFRDLTASFRSELKHQTESLNFKSFCLKTEILKVTY